MSDLYTKADLDRAMRHAWGSDPVPESFAIYRTDMRDALDAVAPAIAARSLREAADDMSRTGGITVPTKTPPDAWLRARADEIERH